MSRVVAFFRSFGFDVETCLALSQRFAAESEPLRKAQDAAAGWLVKAMGPWAAEPAGFAAARSAFVRAGMAQRFPMAFLADEVTDEVRSAFAGQRPLALPDLVPGVMLPQDVRMLPVVDDVLRSVLPLAPRRS
jgi:hypothetical protein